MKNVISVSRRTDIPAFYSDWFIKRLKEGYVYVQQPFSRKWIKVSLSTSDIAAIVFWSKNFSPLITKLEKVEAVSRNLFFNFTITANKELELNVPDFSEAIRDFIYLSKRYSPAQLIWRYDPICIADKLPFEFYLENFTKCIERLKGYAKMCYISFANPYKKVILNVLKYKNQSLLELSSEDKKRYALQLSGIAEKYGIQVYACCNDYLVSNKIKKGSCINSDYLSKIFNIPINCQKSPTRKECACTKSIDIGYYNTCPHGCLYCYANTDKTEAAEFYENHNPEWNSLYENVNEDKINNDEQPSLFIGQK
jgi:hypothetical protein